MHCNEPAALWKELHHIDAAIAEMAKTDYEDGGPKQAVFDAICARQGGLENQILAEPARGPDDLLLKAGVLVRRAKERYFIVDPEYLEILAEDIRRLVPKSAAPAGAVS